MQINLTGKVVLATGTSRGIDRAIAKQAAASGATVAVHGSKKPGPSQGIGAGHWPQEPRLCCQPP